MLMSLCCAVFSIFSNWNQPFVSKGIEIESI
jgi:hypothetical protein